MKDKIEIKTIGDGLTSKIEQAKEKVSGLYYQALILNHKQGGCHKIEMDNDYDVFITHYPSSNSWQEGCHTLHTFQNVDLFEEIEMKPLGDKIIVYGDQVNYETDATARKATKAEKEEANIDEDEDAMILFDSYDETLENIAYNLDVEENIEEIRDYIDSIEAEN